MILIGDASNNSLSEQIASKLNSKVIYPEITVFPDSEQRVRIVGKITGEKVYLLKSITPPVDSAVMQLTFLVDALNKNGADKVIGIIPYIPYMRADHMFRTGEAVPLGVVVGMIQDSRLNEIIMVDPHSVKIPEMFKIPVHDLSALPLFAKKIKEIEPNSDNITIVSPDMGGIRRLKILDELLGGSMNQVVINKDRNYESGEVRIAEYEGKIQGKCFIVDDIISTGKTVVQAIDTLDQGGARSTRGSAGSPLRFGQAGEIYVFATHPVFSENATELLSRSKANKIFITDSIPVPVEKKFKKLEILSIAELISGEIKSRDD